MYCPALQEYTGVLLAVYDTYKVLPVARATNRSRTDDLFRTKEVL
jgi:hypothetical protein